MKTFSDGDALFGPMLNAIISAFRGTSVIDGCEVETSGYWDLRFSVAAGTVQIGGTIVSVAGGSSMLAAASTFERYDLVTITAAGGIHVVQGTQAQKCPAIPANECLVAIIRLPAGATAINTGDVLDARLVGARLADLAIAANKDWRGHRISNVAIDCVALNPKRTVAASTDWRIDVSGGEVVVPPECVSGTINVAVHLIGGWTSDGMSLEAVIYKNGAVVATFTVYGMGDVNEYADPVEISVVAGDRISAAFPSNSIRYGGFRVGCAYDRILIDEDIW